MSKGEVTIPLDDYLDLRRTAEARQKGIETREEKIKIYKRALDEIGGFVSFLSRSDEKFSDKVAMFNKQSSAVTLLKKDSGGYELQFNETT